MPKTKAAGIGLFLVTLLAGPAAAAAPDQAAIAAFEAFVAHEMQTDPMPGLSVAFQYGDTVWAKGFGFADLENRVPATAESSYRMASVTKPMTAVAALRLAEMGKLDLDAPIQTYVSYFPDKDAPITIRQLLAHLGGISHYRDYSKEGRIRDPKTTREAIAIFEAFDLVGPPGSRYHYSTYGYNLAGAALEAAAGKPYGTLMRELVWSPAGMTGTRMDSPSEIIPHRVRGYRTENGRLVNSEFVDISSRFAGGGTRSTVLDMIRFARAVDEGTLIAPASLEAMWTPQATTSGELVYYGLGWGIHPLNGRFQVNHSGSQQETRTLLVHFPQKDLTMAFASNYEEAALSKYRDRLYWHLTGEVWNPAVYVPDREDRLARRAAEITYNEGMAWFDRYGGPFTEDPIALRAGFESFNTTVREIGRDASAARDRIERSVDPAAGRSALVVGSWMASRIVASDPAAKQRLHHEGELALFADYIRLYRRDRSIPRALRFDRAFERRIERLAADWRRAFSPEVREAIVEGAGGAERLLAMLGDSRLSILPSVEDDLVGSMEDDLRRGEWERALAIGTRAIALYPKGARANGAHALALALGGREAEAVRHLRVSLDADPNGYASLDNLGGAVRFLASEQRWADLIALAKVMAAVHPRDTRPLVALGRAYRESGRADEARAALVEALRIDPQSEDAKEELALLAP